MLFQIGLIVVGASLAALPSLSKADEDALKHMLQEKYQFAEIIETAGVVADKCPGLHIIEDNLEVASSDSGATEDDYHSPGIRILGCPRQSCSTRRFPERPGTLV
jgi:hypothetical protein